MRAFTLVFVVLSVIEAIAQDNVQYRKRGNRFEGIYPFKGKLARSFYPKDSLIAIATFSRGPFHFRKDTARSIRVSPANADVIARTYIDSKNPYRLFIDKGTHGEVFWPLKDVMCQRPELTDKTIGIFRYNEGVYYPFEPYRVIADQHEPLWLLLSVKKAMGKIEWRVLDRNCQDSGEPLSVVPFLAGRNFWRPDFPVPIRFDKAASSVVCVEVVATLRENGKKITESFLLKPY